MGAYIDISEKILLELHNNIEKFEKEYKRILNGPDGSVNRVLGLLEWIWI